MTALWSASTTERTCGMVTLASLVMRPVTFLIREKRSKVSSSPGVASSLAAGAFGASLAVLGCVALAAVGVA